MKAFKKIAAVFAAAAMALSLAACSGSNNDGSSAADSGNSAAAGSFRTVDEIKSSGKIRIRSVMLTTTVSSRAMTCISQSASLRISA